MDRVMMSNFLEWMHDGTDDRFAVIDKNRFTLYNKDRYSSLMLDKERADMLSFILSRKENERIVIDNDGMHILPIEYYDVSVTPKTYEWQEIMELDNTKDLARARVVNNMKYVEFDINKHAMPETYLAYGETDYSNAFMRMRNIDKDIYLTRGKTYRVNMKAEHILMGDSNFIGNGATLDMHYYNVASVSFCRGSGVFKFNNLYIKHTVEPTEDESIQNFAYEGSLVFDNVISECVKSKKQMNFCYCNNVSINESYVYDESGRTITVTGFETNLRIANSYVYGSVKNVGYGTCKTSIKNAIISTNEELAFTTFAKQEDGDTSAWMHSAVIDDSFVFYRRNSIGRKCNAFNVGNYSCDNLLLKNSKFGGDVMFILVTEVDEQKHAYINVQGCDLTGLKPTWKQSGGTYYITSDDDTAKIMMV